MSTPRRTFVTRAALALLAPAGGMAASHVGRAQAVPREIPLVGTHIAGVSDHLAPDSVCRMEAGATVVLRRQPQNPYDPRAVEALTLDGQKLGYIPRIDNQALSNLMDAGLRVTARVREIRSDRYHPEVLLNISVVV